MSTWTPDKIHLNVKTEKKLITIEVNQNERISNIKSILASLQPIPAKSQLLIYGNQKLEDNKTLRLYNIKPQSTVYLTEKLNVNDTDYRDMNIETVDNSFISDDEDDTLRMQQQSKNSNKQASFTKLSHSKKKVKSKPSWRYFYKVTNPEVSTLVFNKLKLYIKLPSEKTIALYVDQNYKIYEIKDMVSQIENIPAEKQILKMANKELLNYETLKEYNIQTNARLVLDLKESERKKEHENTNKYDNEYIIVESKDLDEHQEDHYNKNEKHGTNEGYVYRYQPEHEQQQQQHQQQQHSNQNQTIQDSSQNQKQQQQQQQKNKKKDEKNTKQDKEKSKTCTIL